MLTCPPYSPLSRQREAQWRANIADYLESEPLSELLRLFGARIDGRTLLERAAQVRAFVDEQWDYRRKAGSGERWTVHDTDPVVLEHADTILRCAEQLGMIGVKSQRTDADYVMPLGGARAANFDRMDEALHIARRSTDGVPIVALTALRPLGEIEIPYVTDCIPEAQAGVTTEFDVVCRAMERTLGASVTASEGETVAGSPHLGWAIRHYGAHCVVCAPSSEPDKRRANTLDTLRFFSERFAPPAGSVLVLTTSSIYVSYQTASLVPFALAQGWEIELSGTGAPGQHNDVISNYLQEIKGTVDALARYLGV